VNNCNFLSVIHICNHFLYSILLYFFYPCIFIRSNFVFCLLSNPRFITFLFTVFVSKYYQQRQFIVSSVNTLILVFHYHYDSSSCFKIILLRNLIIYHVMVDSKGGHTSRQQFGNM
jgi:hypothetical protein